MVIWWILWFLFIVCTICLFAILQLIYTYARYWNYWKSRNVPTIPRHIIFGNLENPFRSKTLFGFQITDLYKIFERSGTKYGGIYMFTQPLFVPLDLELIRNILSKDASYFDSRGTYACDEEVISSSLINLGGHRSKFIRFVLSRSYTPAKVKLMLNCALDSKILMLDSIDSLIDNSKPINISKLINTFMIHITANSAFGIKLTSKFYERFCHLDKLIYDPNNFNLIKLFFIRFFPHISNILRIRFFPREVDEYFIKFVKDLISYREQHNIKCDDPVQAMIEMMNSKDLKPADTFGSNSDNEFDFNTMVGQVFLIFAATYGTTPNVITLAMYELATNQEIQDRAREEVQKVLKKYGGQCTYEVINETKYITQIVEETIRKYPIAPVLDRKCNRAYQIPDDEIVIEKDTLVHIPVMGIHYNPKYYPEPLKFDPDRFTDENKSQRHPFAFLGFGEGPKSCLGIRAGYLQAKVALIHLLYHYEFTLNKNTTEPLEFDVNFIALSTKGDIWIDAKKLNVK